MTKKTARILSSTFAGVTAAAGAYVLAIRPWHLRWGATDAEVAAILPGDEILPNATGGVTHAITIRASPDQIWPWLMQIGQDRSGFYSYTPLENLVGCDMPKVEKIVPQWRDRVVGETVWFATPKRYRAQAYMVAVVVEPQRSLVLASPKDWANLQAGGQGQEVTWGFYLQPVDEHETRLIARLRAPKKPGVAARVVEYGFWEPAHFVMERRMLTHIKELAEKSAALKTVA